MSVLDEVLWKWAKMRTIQLDHKNISEYIFGLIDKDKKQMERVNKKGNREVLA